MFFNFIIIAWRNLLKNRAVSFINIIGLTLGLASAVLAILFARRYYGNDDPYGEIITIELYGEKIDFRITGVFYDLPSNTHLKADIIIPLSL